MLYTKLLAIFTILPLALGASSHGRRKRACPAKEPVTLPTANTSQPFNYGVDKVRGVNLGGWLVLEKWLSPSLFAATGNDKIIDEWTFGSLQNRSTAEQLLQNHWNTFITEDDFRQISEYGLNHVRIPIGYWAFDIVEGEPFIPGQLAYLDKAITWARAHNIKIQLDLHGVPGSQNGYDHSGRKGAANWHKNSENVKRSVDIVKKISTLYGTPQSADTLTQLSLLNEPTLWISDQIKIVTRQFYQDAYQVARHPWGSLNKTDWTIIIHDGFQRQTYWNDFMTEAQGYEKVWIDDHYYQAFGKEDFGISAEEHIRKACDNGAKNYRASPLPLVMGEWSMGVQECAPAEGKGVGTCDWNEPNYTTEYPAFARAYFEIQAQASELEGKGQGWIFWTWKSDGMGEWSYKLAVEWGWISATAGDYKYKYAETCQMVRNVTVAIPSASTSLAVSSAPSLTAIANAESTLVSASPVSATDSSVTSSAELASVSGTASESFSTAGFAR